MKKVILFFIALLIVSCSKSDSSTTVAKQLSITKLDGTVINDGAVLVFNTTGDENAIMKFYVKNLSSAEIKVRANNHSYEVSAPSGNTFELYLNTIGKCIIDKNYEKFYNDMYIDAFSRNLINNNKNR